MMKASLSSCNQPQQTPSTTSLFVEHLTNLDFSYLDQDVGLSGQSWVVDLEIKGDLNHQGMLLDFGDIKKSIKADVESLWDHKLLVPTQMVTQMGGSIRPVQSQPGVSQLIWQDKHNNRFIHTGPDISIYQVDIAHLDFTFLAQHLEKMLMDKWHSPQIQEIKIQFRQEQSQISNNNSNNQEAFFQYSHGLRLHQGACQRIAHGHRSKLRVFTEQGFNLAFSDILAAQINHGYFLDLGNIEQQTDDSITLSYKAPEGFYQLTLPKQRCIIMNTETTIENIATYLLHHAREHISSEICKIQVYEGWLKGAVARSCS